MKNLFLFKQKVEILVLDYELFVFGFCLKRSNQFVGLRLCTNYTTIISREIYTMFG